MKICSFDIESMYTYIPINELLNIIENIMNQNHNVSHETKTEIRNLLNTTLEQNYIEHNENGTNKTTVLLWEHQIQQF
jgi:hypothetical protein